MELTAIPIELLVCLTAVAALGYIAGCLRKDKERESKSLSRREVRRAKMAVEELERIALTVKKSLTSHKSILGKFKDRLRQLPDSEREQEAAIKDLCREVEEVLQPTLQLATKMASAYDEIRQQSSNLLTITELRTDPLTGVSNRRGLEEMLDNQLAMTSRYGSTFSLAIFDIDHFKQINDQLGHLIGDQTLQKLAKVVNDCARETDTVGRFGGEEFIVIMPHTDLGGGCIFSERARIAVEELMDCTVSGGVTHLLPGDTHDSIIERADQALYTAKAAGRNCVFYHDGRAIHMADIVNLITPAGNAIGKQPAEEVESPEEEEPVETA